jgi:hypothetical protein
MMTPEQEAALIARIARESEERFGKGASKEKFAWRNEQRAKLGLGAEKRKRGGVSGVWDRNKNVIKPVAAGVAGLLTGGAAVPALMGAAMEGFDRPGKSGIGFDFGQGIKGAGMGALSGAAGATLGGGLSMGAGAAGPGGMAGAKQSLSSYFGMGKPAPPSAGTGAVMSPTGSPGLMSMDPNVAAQAGAAGMGAAPAAAPAAAGTGGAMDMLKGIGNFVKENPMAAGMAAQGAGAAIGAQADRRVAEGNQSIDQERLRLERERWEQEQESRRRIAELLAPLLSKESQYSQSLPLPQVPNWNEQRPAWL